MILALACARPVEKPPAVVAPSTTVNGLYTVSWRPRPDPVPMGQLFEIETTVKEAKTGAPLTTGTVRVDARMPEHGHGMATRPEDDLAATHPDGVYVTRGMKFHMPGSWTLSFVVEGPAGADRFEVAHRL